MVYNNNRYLVFDQEALDSITESELIGETKLWARPNIAGNRWIVEVQPGSIYYNDPSAKTHQEALLMVEGSEWSQGPFDDLEGDGILGSPPPII